MSSKVSQNLSLNNDQTEEENKFRHEAFSNSSSFLSMRPEAVAKAQKLCLGFKTPLSVTEFMLRACHPFISNFDYDNNDEK